MNPRPVTRPLTALSVACTLIFAACAGAPAASDPAAAPQPAATHTPGITAAQPTVAATAQQQDASKVTVWTHGGTSEEAEALTQILEKFRAQRPDIRFDLVHVPQDTYDTQVQAALYTASPARGRARAGYAHAHKDR